jgi:hypothetical protein
MLVYGDPQHRELLSRSLLRIRRCQAGQTRLAAADRLERTRTALIFAGQLEQAVLDDPHADEWEDASELRMELGRLTAHAATRFVRSWADLHESGWGEAFANMSSNSGTFARSLDRLESRRDRLLNLKTPEGFAFYALYPEQYIEAALAWMGAHPGGQEGGVLVVGIRSIGTTLAAVVTAVLQAHRWTAHTITVRPYGHPFDRRLALDRSLASQARWALVVDEGPPVSSPCGSAPAASCHGVCARTGRDGARLRGHAVDRGDSADWAISWHQLLPTHWPIFGRLERPALGCGGAGGRHSTAAAHAAG